MSQNMEFKTDRLTAAAFMLCRGFKFLRTEPCAWKPRILQFVFADPENKGTEAIADYYAGGTVVATQYGDRITFLKGLLWQQKDGAQ